MLTKNENLLFLQKKIGEIKIARFSAEIDAGLQLPNNIVSTLKTAVNYAVFKVYAQY